MKNKYSGILYITFLIMIAAMSGSIRGYLLAIRHQKSLKAAASSGKKSDSVSPHTLSQIQQSLVRREYHISYDSLKQALQSPNRAQELRAYYKPGKLTVINRKDSVGHNFKLELVNEGVFTDGVKQFEPEVSAENDLTGNALEIYHKGFTEQYINDSSGIRQNFIVNQAPQGTKQLQVRLNATGMPVSELGTTELELTSKNGSKLYYRDLKCWDANKKPLDARMAYADGKIQIDVAVTGAAFPVTIDPLIVNGNPLNANALLEKDQGLANFGGSVASAGDVNGDGYSDVIIGAPMYDNNETNEGAAFIYHGSAAGLTNNPACMLEGNQAEARFGTSVSTAGDVNGDGFSDVIVGAPLYDKNETNEGAAFVYHGSANAGIGTVAVTILESNQPESNFGQSVALAGDVNNNGFSDVIVGAPMFDKGENNEGAAFVFHGSAAGGANMAGSILEKNQPDSQFGFSVRAAGDVNGDAYSDVIVGAFLFDNGENNEGAAFVFHGSAGGIGLNAVTTLESNQSTAYFGYSVSVAGDVNLDGFSDVIVGSFLFDNGESNEGAAFVYHGSQQGTKNNVAKLLECNQAGAQYAVSVAAAGDVNGDGIADVIVGANYFDKGQGNEGGAFVYEGSITGLNGVPVSILEGDQNSAGLGSSAASAGDVNGDGYSDVIAGAPLYDKGQGDEGAAFVWHGGARSIAEMVVTHLEMNIANSQFGWSVASAGDVNGDGFKDVIVSANNYDNGQPYEGAAFVFHGAPQGLPAVPNFTFEGNQQNASLGSVAGAGDINGDGFDDILVGIQLFDNGTANTGKVCVVYGSSTGLGTGSGNLPVTTILGTQEEAKFGSAVSSAGDVNKDGYADIIVGEPEYDISDSYMDEGRAHVYYGSANGINLNISPGIINGNTEGMYMGAHVAGSIDTNNDGFGDVLVGNPFYTKGHDYEGAVFVYNGSQNGVITANPIILESNSPGAEMGKVSNAGDVNGDGFTDIAVGAYKYSNGQYAEGAVFVYMGSANGLSNAPLILEKNVINAYLGNVASGGDVNGDGYSDLLIGSIGFSNGQDNEGAIYLFYGSPAGLQIANSLLIEGNQNSAFLGSSVAGAGDINGDGYSDIIVSAHQYDHDQQNEGRTSIYYGNSTLSTRNSLRLYNSNLTTPINHNQFAQNNFGAGLFAKSFLGRGKGKLVWETKSAGQSFSKSNNNSITNSTQYSGMQGAYTNLWLNGVELKSVINKQGTSTKIRTRVKYDPVLALTGQAYGPWRYLPAYLMGNSTSPVPENAQDILSQTKNSNDIMDANKWSEQVSVYPNPASDYLNINAHNPDQVKTIKIMTITGFLVYQSKGFKSSIDLKSLSRGVYSVIVTNQDGVQTTRKIVVAK